MKAIAPQVEIHEGDATHIMQTLPASSVDAIITDPPYGLEFMGKEWDRFKSPNARIRQRIDGRTNPSQGKSTVTTPEAFIAGTPFQAWCETWAREAHRLLKPGGHLLAFGGTRTNHRLACAIEDAGFEIRDTIAWLYGSGFPKSHNLNGNHTGWGTALKPAHEPITLARKPPDSTIANNVLKHGTGALNIDACRIRFANAADEVESKEKNRHGDFGTEHGGNAVYGDYTRDEPRKNYDPPGRWPANVVLDPHAAAQLDAQTGQSVSRAGKPRTGTNGNGWGMTATGTEHDDTGGASRFYYTAKASTTERNAGLEIERNTHPTVKPIDLMRWLTKLTTPPRGTILDPFTGSGTTGIAATLEGFNFIGIEQNPEYTAIARARIKWWANGNHPQTPPPTHHPAQLDLFH